MPGTPERPLRCYREARLLDDKDWESWLELYAPDAEFWMPSWDDDDQLVTDPQRQISLIWSGNKGGLEDRIFRIRTERSSATSMPEPRTQHGGLARIAGFDRPDATDQRAPVAFTFSRAATGVTIQFIFETLR